MLRENLFILSSGGAFGEADDIAKQEEFFKRFHKKLSMYIVNTMHNIQKDMDVWHQDSTGVYYDADENSFFEVDNPNLCEVQEVIELSLERGVDLLTKYLHREEEYRRKRRESLLHNAIKDITKESILAKIKKESEGRKDAGQVLKGKEEVGVL